MKKFINKFIRARWQSKIAKLQPCPLPKPLTLVKGGKVLVFSPHPDDETLGCGGTLALLRDNGCTIKVVFVTDGGGAGSLPEGSIAIRQQEAKAALTTLGVQDWLFLDEPDGSFRNHPKFERQALEIMQQFQADWLFLPSVLDYHRDHVAIGQTLFSLWQRYKTAERLFFYEIWSPVPATHVVDISSVIDLKRQAISHYQLPLEHCDYLSAIMGLAAYRGLYLSGNGHPKFAEAFVEAENNGSWSGMPERMLSLRVYLEKRLKQ
ncbi:MAG: PIG-L family deacetylase [Methylobacter sp.]|nr:PIG-L family deacetylase [Candidatus Methylobacter titanis]